LRFVSDDFADDFLIYPLHDPDPKTGVKPKEHLVGDTCGGNPSASKCENARIKPSFLTVSRITLPLAC
jgi:hypothetical protein